MGRTSLPVTTETKARFDEFKQDSETIDAAVNRALDDADGEFTPDDSGGDTEEIIARLDELASNLPNETADAVANRLP